MNVCVNMSFRRLWTAELSYCNHLRTLQLHGHHLNPLNRPHPTQEEPRPFSSSKCASKYTTTYTCGKHYDHGCEQTVHYSDATVRRGILNHVRRVSAAHHLLKLRKHDRKWKAERRHLKTILTSAGFSAHHKAPAAAPAAAAAAA